MSYERRRALTQQELEDEILRLSDDDFVESDNEEVVSEDEDNVEYVQEEDDDYIPEQENVATSDNAAEEGESTFNQYKAKSGKLWTPNPTIRGRRRGHNILVEKTGLTEYSSTATDVLDTFNLFLTNDMKEIICRHTNEEAERVYGSYNEKNTDNQKNWNILTEVELDAFIGVLLSAGALRCRKEHTTEMWTTDESVRRSIFTATMSRDRFIAIRTFIRFDDKMTRQIRRETDKLAAIRDIWDKFVENCKKSFVPGGSLTIDEQLVAFRGNCPFRQYIKSKPAKYGIKIWALADVETTYLYNLQIYTGKLPGAQPEKNQGARVVKDLMTPLFNTGRGVTTDNFFTSAPLAEELLAKKITILGTVRKNKPDTPEELKKMAGRSVHSSKFAFSGNLSLVSYVPKKGRMVHLLSSQHNTPDISEKEGKKPTMIEDYNSTKGAVDNADKLIREYTCSRRTARWPFRIFMQLLDSAALNAYVIYTTKNPEWMKTCSFRRRYFLKMLGGQLAKENMKLRLPFLRNNQHVLRAIEACGVNILSTEGVQDVLEPQARKRGRCRLCPRSTDRKIEVKCNSCQMFICKNHRRGEIIKNVYCCDHENP